jgi:beta-mannosidase
MSVVDLSSQKWTLSCVSDKNEKLQNIAVSKIPTLVHLDLLQNGLIEDPYESYNELKQLWIAENDWIYSTTVKIDKPTQKQYYLIFEGLDTLCTISMNDKIILETDNMFLRHIIDITEYVKNGSFTLSLLFRSALKFCREASQNAPYPIPSPQYTQCFPTPGRNYLRKVGCDFGWDWGVCTIPCGPHKPIYLLSCETNFIQDVVVTQSNHVFENNTCISVDIEIKTFLYNKNPTKLEYMILDLSKSGFEAVVLQQLNETTQENISIVKTTIRNPQLWWPNGYGDQNLYSVHVKIIDEQLEHFYFARTARIGIRELILDTSADQHGNKFTFVVNRIPIYAKGSNWIPSDCFSTRITHDHLNILLKSARETHQNMMRVWGGGSYESDTFYELCDNYGILLWHDMMFACSLYPSTDDFLTSVRTEIQQQIRRIQHHPCIALYAGNNENEEALRSWPDAKDERYKDRYLIDYYKLYYDTIYNVIKQEDCSRPYLPSSPTNGLDQWGNPQDHTRGDAHYWAVWHQNKPFSAYRTVTPRFSSEFGFQSIPSLETLLPYVGNEDLNISSAPIEFRQRSFLVGNKCILEHMSREFRLPKNFFFTIYLSQINQAIAIKTACEHWRRQKAICSGALYWQLNDIWPGMSWSSIEWNCKWKLLHYAAQEFFAPVLVSMFEENNKVHVWITTDEIKTLEGTLTLQLISYQNGNKLKEWTSHVKVEPNGSECVYILELDELFGTKLHYYDYLDKKEISRSGCFLIAEFVPRDILVNNGSPVTNLLFFVPLKNVNLPKANLKAKILTRDTASWLLEVTSDAVAPFVYLRLLCDHEEKTTRTNIDDIPRCAGRFSANGFLMMPGETRQVTFYRFSDEELGDCRLQVVSLSDSYM